MHSLPEEAKELGKLLQKSWWDADMISCLSRGLQMHWKRFQQKFIQFRQRKCHWFAIDLAKEKAAEAVFEWVNENQFEVSILVNNAGYGLSGSFENYTADEHAEMLDLNIITLTKLTRLFLPLLLKQRAAYILNIGSTASYQAVPILSTYAASKAYVLSFSRGLYQELKKTNVSVTCVCPGPTDTNFVNRAHIGPKGRKAAERFNMSPQNVAHDFSRKPFSKEA